MHLTRSMRIRAGRLIALAYLFCVLAPAAALAWGHGPAPCFGDDALLTDAVWTHQQAAADHMNSAGAMHDHAAMHGHLHAFAQGIPAEHHHHDKGAPGPCCAMMCVSALPAELPDVATPVRPISACAPEIAVQLHSEAPPLLYRPPIA